MKKIVFSIGEESINQAIKQIEEYKAEMQRKADKLTSILADAGLEEARTIFATAKYDGTNDVEVEKTKIKNGYVVTASGKAVCFIEFGSGVIGYGHPEADEFGMGPSTWSLSDQGKGHWDNPPWYFAHGQKSSGNPPAMAMWKAEQEIKRKIKSAVKEVFK